MYDHIFVPLDGSDFSETALNHALELAAKFDSRVTLARVVTPITHYVIEPASMYAAEAILESYKQERVATEGYLSEKVAEIEKKGIRVESHMLEGAPIYECLLKAVGETDADLLVMNTHGRSGVRRLLFGSVAEDVLRHAEVPVLLIRGE